MRRNLGVSAHVEGRGMALMAKARTAAKQGCPAVGGSQ
jgi:hypothetical protein